MHKPIKLLYAIVITVLVVGAVAYGVYREAKKPVVVVNVNTPTIDTDTQPIDSNEPNVIYSYDQSVDSGQPNIKDYIVKTADPKETFVVKGNIAVFASMSDSRVKKMKSGLKGQDLDNFYTATDDQMFYESQARDYLEKKGIKIVDTQKRYISFTHLDGTTVFIDTELNKDSLSLLILFQNGRLPLLASTLDIKDDYIQYFDFNSAHDSLVGTWKSVKNGAIDQIVFEVKNGGRVYSDYSNNKLDNTCRWYHSKDMISLDGCHQPGWKDSDGTTEAIGDIKKLTTDEFDVDFGGPEHTFSYKRIK